ncbi:MAG: VOC family protein [Acidimicrobiales bacterium]
MANLVTATEFNSAEGLADWRFLLGRVEAQFSASSFDGATSFAHQIAGLANAANHHPDIDIRYPDKVFVALVTHASGGLTGLDLELARSISKLAGDSDVVCRPLPTSRVEIAIDALDIDAVRPFWQAVLGYEAPPGEGDGQILDIFDPNRIGPSVWFQQMDEPRTNRNRLHLDIAVAHDQAEARVAEAIAAGGTLVSDSRAKAFWILADAEGNEACICTWQDRD